MELTSIKRQFTFATTLKKYNKINNPTLTLTDIFILYAIDCAKGFRCTFSDLEALLKRNSHTRSKNRIIESLKLFEQAGYVLKASTNPVTYRLTVRGKNVLYELERMIRQQRIEG